MQDGHSMVTIVLTWWRQTVSRTGDHVRYEGLETAGVTGEGARQMVPPGVLRRRHGAKMSQADSYCTEECDVEETVFYLASFPQDV